MADRTQRHSQPASKRPPRIQAQNRSRLLGSGHGFQRCRVIGRCMRLLQTVSSARAHVVLLQVLSYQLDGNGSPAGAGVGLRVVAEGVEMCQILLDKGEGLLLVTPAASEISFASRTLAHPLKDGRGNGLQLYLPG